MSFFTDKILIKEYLQFIAYFQMKEEKTKIQQFGIKTYHPVLLNHKNPKIYHLYLIFKNLESKKKYTNMNTIVFSLI